MILQLGSVVSRVRRRSTHSSAGGIDIFNRDVAAPDMGRGEVVGSRKDGVVVGKIFDDVVIVVVVLRRFFQLQLPFQLVDLRFAFLQLLLRNTVDEGELF